MLACCVGSAVCQVPKYEIHYIDKEVIKHQIEYVEKLVEVSEGSIRLSLFGICQSPWR